MSLNSLMDMSRVSVWVFRILLVLLDLNELFGWSFVAAAISVDIFIAIGCCFVCVQSLSCFTWDWAMVDASSMLRSFQAILISDHAKIIFVRVLVCVYAVVVVVFFFFWSDAGLGWGC